MLDLASVISRLSTSERKNGHRVEAPQLRRVASANAVPQPYQAGSRQRFCVQAKTHGIARSDASEPRPGPPRGTRAQCEQLELVDRRERAEERHERGVVDEGAVGQACALGQRRHERECIGAGSEPATCGNADTTPNSASATRTSARPPPESLVMAIKRVRGSS